MPFVGTFLTLLIGSVMGMVSGYFAGRVDHYIQRFIEVLLALPSLPLWLALAAAMPLSMPSGYRYLLIIVILSIIDWGGLARVVRGKVLQYRGEDFVAAAQMSGASLGRIIFRHGAVRDRHRAGVQLRRRRHARRGGSLLMGQGSAALPQATRGWRLAIGPTFGAGRRPVASGALEFTRCRRLPPGWSRRAAAVGG